MSAGNLFACRVTKNLESNHRQADWMARYPGFGNKILTVVRRFPKAIMISLNH